MLSRCNAPCVWHQHPIRNDDVCVPKTDTFGKTPNARIDTKGDTCLAKLRVVNTGSMIPLASSSTSTLLFNEDMKQALYSGEDFGVLEKIVADSAFNIVVFLKEQLSSSTSSSTSTTIWTTHQHHQAARELKAPPSDADPINSVPVLTLEVAPPTAAAIAEAAIAEAAIAQAAFAEALAQDKDEEDEGDEDVKFAWVGGQRCKVSPGEKKRWRRR